MMVLLLAALVVPVVMAVWLLPPAMVAYLVWRAWFAKVSAGRGARAFFLALGGLASLTPVAGSLPLPTVILLVVNAAGHRMPWLLWMVLAGLTAERVLVLCDARSR